MSVAQPVNTPRKRTWRFYLTVGCLGALALAISFAAIGAAVAIPMYIEFVKRTKLAEAQSALRFLRLSVEEECLELHSLPAPLAPTLDAVGRARRTPTLDERWRAYGVSGEPSFYAYSIEREGTTARLVAEGDLDEDGVRSRLVYACAANCSCGELQVENELE
jgi:Tfp pilus assembly major pilin PilA